jgi:hypothetical protein
MNMLLQQQLNDDQLRFLQQLDAMGVLNTDVNSIIAKFSPPKIKKRKNIKLKQSQNSIYKNCVVLPYCGKIIKDNCYAMRKNHGLYTQCKRKRDDNDYCECCSEAAKNSSTEKPPYGDIRERDMLVANKELVGIITYGNVLEKLNIDKKQAEKDAMRLGWTIPDIQWEITKKKRGRPKKKRDITFVEDTDDEDENIPETSPTDNATDDDILTYLLCKCDE